MLSTIIVLLLSFGKACIAIRANWYSPEPFSSSSSQTEIWYEREIKELTWKTDMPDYGIYLTQGTQKNSLGDWVCIYHKQKDNTPQTRMLWTVQSFPSFDLGLINSFFLQINDNNGTSKITHYFSIRNATQNTTNTCPQNTASSTLESDLLRSDGKARMIGIGLGVGLGVPLLAALASLAFLLTSFRRIDKDEIQDTKTGVVTTVEEPRKDFYYHHEASDQNEIYEIANHDAIHEAPDSNAVLHR